MNPRIPTFHNIIGVFSSVQLQCLTVAAAQFKVMSLRLGAAFGLTTTSQVLTMLSCEWFYVVALPYSTRFNFLALFLGGGQNISWSRPGCSCRQK